MPRVSCAATGLERVPDPVIALNRERRVFQRSFTAKGGEGRGIGTYSVKLFAERYFCTRVDLTSAEPDGTIFSVRLPRRQGEGAREATLIL